MAKRLKLSAFRQYDIESKPYALYESKINKKMDGQRRSIAIMTGIVIKLQHKKYFNLHLENGKAR